MKNTIDIHELKNIKSVDFAGVKFYEKKEVLTDSEIFGIPVKFLAAGGAALWLMKRFLV